MEKCFRVFVKLKEVCDIFTSGKYVLDEAFINNLKHIYEVDKHVGLMEITYEKFIKKWTLYNHLVT